MLRWKSVFCFKVEIVLRVLKFNGTNIRDTYIQLLEALGTITSLSKKLCRSRLYSFNHFPWKSWKSSYNEWCTILKGYNWSLHGLVHDHRWLNFTFARIGNHADVTSGKSGARRDADYVCLLIG
ncbi:hypothetical protein ACFE04_024515 [Oxalis oulophora]